MEHELAPSSIEQERIKAPASSSSVQAKPIVESRTHPVLGLQRKVGNWVVQGLVNAGKIQTKLAVERPGDRYEQEADRMAEQVVTSDASYTLQRSSASSMGSVESSTAPPIVNNVLNSGNSCPLDAAVRPVMEKHFQQDFGHVRVHTDGKAAESAQAVNAHAYTVGSDIVFGAGQYAPGTATGKRLLAHELTHVVQQGSQSNQGNGAIDSTGVLVQRQNKATPVDIINIPESKLSVSDLVDATFHHSVSILDGYHQALEDFQTIVNAASAKQAIPKGVGEIALEHVGKFVVKQLKDIVFDHFPYAKKINEIAEEGVAILEDVEKEKKRAEEAGQSNALGQFVVKQGRDISKMHRALDDTWVSTRSETERRYMQMSDSDKKMFRDNLVLMESMSARLAQISTAEALFQMIAERWIVASPSAYVFIRLDRDWKVKTAYIHAPRGQQLAEELLRDGGAKVKLNDLKVRRRVEFFPEDLTWVFADFDAENKLVPDTLGFNLFGQKYVQMFITNITTLGIPETTVLTGD